MRSFQEKEEVVLKMLDRIKKSNDGPEFMDYLAELSLMNYRAFKQGAPEVDEYCKGYAVAVDSIIQSFDNCTRKLAEIQAAQKLTPDPDDEDGNPTTLHG